MIDFITGDLNYECNILTSAVCPCPANVLVIATTDVAKHSYKHTQPALVFQNAIFEKLNQESYYIE